MGDFWEKLATDWSSFGWLFTIIHDFFIFVGPAMAGIGLGRNPNGIASQVFDGYRALRRREARPILWIGTIITVVFWSLRVSEVIDGWTFLLLFFPTILLSPLIAEAKTKDLRQTQTQPLELIGIDQDFSQEILDELNEQLNLPATPAKSSTES